MKKIDLHIHTVPTVSDSYFEFDINKLKEYVQKLSLDCIAITNHNTFDLEQFLRIKEELEITVLPGVEINLEGGHLLLISDIEDAADLNNKCTYLSNHIKSDKDFISIATFKELFPNFKRYILIPHYHKSPKLNKQVIEDLAPYVTAGEVSSVKKFLSCIKEENALVPLLFSDCRISSNMKNFSIRHTYVDLDEVTITGLKYCFADKQKVFLSESDANEFFQATDTGLMLSTGLNVILGERSSGKTFNLDIIAKSFGNVKYIKQFSLLQDDEKKFEELLSRRHSSVSENYLAEFREVINDVKDVDLRQNDIDIKSYVDSLVKFATESEKKDAYSNAALFSETPFALKELKSLKKLIDSTTLLKENIEYKNIINKHISKESLLSLEVDLMKEYIKIQKSNKEKEWVNSLVDGIKSELRFRTSATPPEDVDFYNILRDNYKANKFDEICKNLKQEKRIDSKDIRNFKIIATVHPFASASELQKLCSRRPKFGSAFPKYSNPYEYLCALKELDLEETELYKYFAKIEYSTLNRHGFNVSGGERSEFNLLHEINDALKFDMLLIDEPESSFDNIFLKNEVNSLLKDISKDIPVIVVTHNNTVGASIKPNYIVCTKREIGEEITYRVYSGYPTDKKLVSPEGEEIDNYELMLNCLEAGNEEYNKRRTETYEILKN